LPKTSMNDMLKRRMTATQQASELQTSDEAYEKLFQHPPLAPPGYVIYLWTGFLIF